MSKNAAKIKDYVINTVADDYENFSLISKEVREWAVDEDTPFTREILIESLRELVADGSVDCFLFSQEKKIYEPVAFNFNQLDELWFYVSATGRSRLSRMDRTE